MGAIVYGTIFIVVNIVVDVSYGLDPWSFTLPVARLGRRRDRARPVLRVAVVQVFDEPTPSKTQFFA